VPFLLEDEHKTAVSDVPLVEEHTLQAGNVPSLSFQPVQSQDQ
jgi:hypothetical protein